MKQLYILYCSFCIVTIGPRGEDQSIQLQVEKMIEYLESINIIEVRRGAAADSRLLAKYNMENKIIIANCRAIRPLMALLHSSNLKNR